MSALDLFSTIAWTLAAPNADCLLKVDRSVVEWCESGACEAVATVSAASPARWKLEPQGIEIRWTNSDSATATCKSDSVSLTVTRDAKTHAPPPPVPRAQVNQALGLAQDQVVPGRWRRAARACEEGTSAWSFTPLGSQNPLYVDQFEGAWRVLQATSGVPVMCPGGTLGGLYPPKPQ